MKQVVLYLLIISFLSLFLVGGMNSVLAVVDGDGEPGDNGGGEPGDDWSVPNPLGEGTTFETLVTNIANWIFTLAIPIAVIVIIYSGVLFMMAGGNEEKIAQAKKTLFWAIVGVSIALIGNGLIYLIKDILGVE